MTQSYTPPKNDRECVNSMLKAIGDGISKACTDGDGAFDETPAIAVVTNYVSALRSEAWVLRAALDETVRRLREISVRGGGPAWTSSRDMIAHEYLWWIPDLEKALDATVAHEMPQVLGHAATKEWCAAIDEHHKSTEEQVQHWRVAHSDLVDRLDAKDVEIEELRKAATRLLGCAIDAYKAENIMAYRTQLSVAAELMHKALTRTGT